MLLRLLLRRRRLLEGRLVIVIAGSVSAAIRLILRRWRLLSTVLRGWRLLIRSALVVGRRRSVMILTRMRLLLLWRWLLLLH